MTWSWKVADRDKNQDLNLRYEPGNWGDVIKGVWALATARAVAAGRERCVAASNRLMRLWRRRLACFPAPPGSTRRLAVRSTFIFSPKYDDDFKLDFHRQLVSVNAIGRWFGGV